MLYKRKYKILRAIKIKTTLRGWSQIVLFRDSLLPRPENGPGTKAGKERVLYYLQAHARNEPIILN